MFYLCVATTSMDAAYCSTLDKHLSPSLLIFIGNCLTIFLLSYDGYCCCCCWWWCFQFSCCVFTYLIFFCQYLDFSCTHTLRLSHSNSILYTRNTIIFEIFTVTDSQAHNGTNKNNSTKGERKKIKMSTNIIVESWVFVCM